MKPGKQTNVLWISSRTGVKYTTKNLGTLISKITFQTLGVNVSPHLSEHLRPRHPQSWAARPSILRVLYSVTMIQELRTITMYIRPEFRRRRFLPRLFPNCANEKNESVYQSGAGRPVPLRQSPTRSIALRFLDTFRTFCLDPPAEFRAPCDMLRLDDPIAT